MFFQFVLILSLNSQDCQYRVDRQENIVNILSASLIENICYSQISHVDFTHKHLFRFNLTLFKKGQGILIFEKVQRKYLPFADSHEQMALFYMFLLLESDKASTKFQLQIESLQIFPFFVNAGVFNQNIQIFIIV